MKRVKQDTAINASSMADIAFLLLIFFLVTTTIDFDQGIMHLLPKWEKEPKSQPRHARNTLKVLVDGQNRLLINDEPASLSLLRETAKSFIDNHGQNPKFSDSPTDAIISLQNHESTSYGTYLQVQNELKGAYRELRDEQAQRLYGQTYQQLRQANPSEAEKIKKAYPMNLTEPEPYAAAE